MGRRRFSPERKMEIVLEALRDGDRVPELLSRHGISLDLLEDWKQRFLEMGLQGLRYGKTTREKALEKVIADQAMTISILEEVKRHLQKKGLLRSPRESSAGGVSCEGL